jgi:hypothetical protein
MSMWPKIPPRKAPPHLSEGHQGCLPLRRRFKGRCNSMGRCKGRCNSMGRCKGRCNSMGRCNGMGR